MYIYIYIYITLLQIYNYLNLHKHRNPRRPSPLVLSGRIATAITTPTAVSFQNIMFVFAA